MQSIILVNTLCGFVQSIGKSNMEFVYVYITDLVSMDFQTSQVCKI